MIYGLMCLFYKLEAFKIWATLNWPFKVTQGQILWCILTPHVYDFLLV